MSSLVWVGNYLFPRSLVFLTVGIIALVVIGCFVVVMREGK